MPEPEDAEGRALKRLDERLGAFEASREVVRRPSGLGEAASDVYQLIAQLVGGVLGGLGIGWLIDRFAGVTPWGIIGGLLIGSGLSIFATVKLAARISEKAARRQAEASPAVKERED
ncbi:MAG: AtpZ/AtpI family protein [Caulobacteraceae bacterium]